MPTHEPNITRLNRVTGQLAGVKKMIEEGRYCPEILTQIRAASSALKAVEMKILQTHLRQCVTQATRAKKSADAENKIEELVELLERY